MSLLKTYSYSFHTFTQKSQEQNLHKHVRFIAIILMKSTSARRHSFKIGAVSPPRNRIHTSKLINFGLKISYMPTNAEIYPHFQRVSILFVFFSNKVTYYG